MNDSGRAVPSTRSTHAFHVGSRVAPGASTRARCYRGGCPCGTVLWQVELDLAASDELASSVWQRTVAAHAFVLLQGADSLSGYQYFDHSAHHFFCTRCGMHAFSHHASAADVQHDAYAIDLRCLHAPSAGSSKPGASRTTTQLPQHTSQS